MNITLYNMKTERNRLNKGAFLAPIITMVGTLRNSCNLTTPTILIELDVETLKESLLKNIYVVYDNKDYVSYNSSKVIYELVNKILNCNYVQISEFNRYYFIDEINVVRNNLYSISMSVDVLMSYYDNINNLDCLIARNEYEYNLNLIDTKDYYEYYNDVREYKPSMISGYNLTSLKSVDVNPLSSYNYVLNVINNESGIEIDTISTPSHVLPSVNGACLPSGVDYYYILPTIDVVKLSSDVIANDSLASFIKSLIVYPFKIPNIISSGGNTIKVGNTTLNGYHANLLQNGNMVNYLYNAYFRIDKPFNDYRDYEPYTQYEIYIPFLGWVKLDSNNVLNCNLLLSYAININDGSAIVLLTDETNNKLIYTSSCILGVKVGLNTTNALEIERNKFGNTIGVGVGALSTTLGTLASIGTGNILGAIGGGVALTSTITQGISNELKNIEKASASVNGGYLGLYTPNEVRIRITSNHRLYDDIEINDYLKYYGKPLNAFRKIKDCRGYTEVSQVHIDNIDNATTFEINSIENILKNGIII